MTMKLTSQRRNRNTPVRLAVLFIQFDIHGLA
jgi:hypothetical protein